jgi:spore germination protein KC
VKKRLTLLLTILFSSFLLSSCIPVKQLNERALVQAIGIDYEEQLIRLTLQIFSPASEEANGLGASARNAKIIESEGNTLTQAFTNANLLQGKEVFIGHNGIIILGRSFIENNLEEALSYFSSIPIARKNASLVIAENGAREIIKANINQGILPAQALQNIIQNNENNGLIQNMKFYEFLRIYQTANEAAVVPIISLRFQHTIKTANQNNAQSQQGNIQEISSLTIDGMAIIANGTFVGKLNAEETRGALWIRNAIKETNIVTATDTFMVAALDIYKAKSKLKPVIHDDNIKFILHINCEAILNETILKKGKVVNKNDIEKVKKAAAEEITRDCKMAFQKAIIEYRCDIFHLSRLLEKEDYQLWNKLKDNWAENIKQIEFDVNVTVKTNRLGLSLDKT